jgi:hypothetical protein
MHKYLRFTIVHEETHNYHCSVESNNFGATTTTTKTWKRQRQPFSWSIIRPETSMETFTKSCPYCGENMKIAVQSLAQMTSYKEKAPKEMLIGMLLLLFSTLLEIATVVWGVPNNPLTLSGFFGGIIVGIVGFIILAMGFAYRDGGGVGYIRRGGLTDKAWVEPHPFDGHFVEEFESRSDYPF